MKTLIILLSISAFAASADAIIGPVVSRSLGNTCASICTCNSGECDYEGPAAKNCTAGGKSSNCCSYCAQ